MSTEDEHNPECQGYTPFDIGIDDILQDLGISEASSLSDLLAQARDGLLDVGGTEGHNRPTEEEASPRDEPTARAIDDDAASEEPGPNFDRS